MEFIHMQETYYILESNPLFNRRFENIFSHSEDFLSLCCFSLLCTFLSLIQSHLFIFYFVACAFSVALTDIMEVFPMLSYSSFRVQNIMLKSLIHFELIFVYGVRQGTDFTLLHIDTQFSLHHLLKRLSSLCILGILVEGQLTVHVQIYFWALKSVSLVYMSVLMPILFHFHYCSVMV